MDPSQPQRTWAEWFSSFGSSQQQTPVNGTVAATSPDGVQGGRKRKSKKTRRGGKKSRKSKQFRK